LQRIAALRIRGAQREAFEDVVVEEVPVALVYNGQPHAVMMATPADLHDFALGFSLSEGIVADAGELELVDCLRTAHGMSLQMLIPHVRFAALAERGRNLAGRTGCGLCGVESLEAAIRPVQRVRHGAPIAADAIAGGLRMLAERQPLNRASGGVHAAGYVVGDAILVREDVGRHNALDKLIGALAARQRPAESGASASRDQALGPGFRRDAHEGFLVITSRGSYEIVHKAASAGIAVIAAISAPTDLAIRLAEEAGVTLIAFARGTTMTVYTHAARIR
jgi:formate dehydrogenase accessory protein FdhD